MLYQMVMLLMIWVTPNPPNHPNFCIFIAFDIFVLGQHNPAYGLQTVPQRGVVTSRDPFLPRDAILSAVYAVVVCLCVCVCVCLSQDHANNAVR